MGIELPMAREEEERWAELLASVSNRVFRPKSNSRDKRPQEPATPRGYEAATTKDITPKSKSSRKAKGTDGVSSKPKRRGRDNKNREQDRGYEGENTTLRRSAQQLGITFPVSCNSTAHYWIGQEIVYSGVLFQCRSCRNYLWLPTYTQEAVELGKLIEHYGTDGGYCRYLDRSSHRPAKIMVAKLQELYRLSGSVTDKVQFARLTDKILSNKDYDEYGEELS